MQPEGMRSTRASWLQWVLLTGTLALVLMTSSMGCAEESAPVPVWSWEWEAGARKSFFIPALEIGGFIFGLNQIDRHFVDAQEYGTNAHTFWKNLTSAAVIDNDPFSVNQLGHPYQGSIYYGFARSAGLTYWQSLLYRMFTF